MGITLGNYLQVVYMKTITGRGHLVCGLVVLFHFNVFLHVSNRDSKAMINFIVQTDQNCSKSGYFMPISVSPKLVLKHEKKIDLKRTRIICL